jgi:hypothetical protein
VISNNARVARALYLLKLDLDNFVPREFGNCHQDQTLTVLNQILGQSRDSQRPFHNMKTQDLLAVIQASWWNVFDRAMGGIEPGLVREVALTHETWAGRNNFGSETAFQALNSIQRLLAAMSSPSTLELDMLIRECLESEIEAAEREGEGIPHGGDEPTESSTRVGDEDTVVDVQPPTAEAVPDGAMEEGERQVGATDQDPYVADLLRALREAGALREEDYLTRAVRDGIDDQCAEVSLFQELSPSLAQALGEQGIHRLFAYQGEALSHTLAGSNVALEAGWTADETVTMAIPLAESLLRNPGCGGLVLCSDEGLVEILVERLSTLLSGTRILVIADTEGLSEPTPDVGDQLPATVLVTSVERLNSALVTLPPGWFSVLKDLKLVAIPQAQHYRGYFGSNVAVLLRRFAHRLGVLGASPQYFVLAQGCANGIELARDLIGQDFQAVSGLERPAARRHYVVVSPRDPEGPGQVDFADRIARAAFACLAAGKSVLIYCEGESLAQTAFNAAMELREGTNVEEGSLSLGGENQLVLPYNGSSNEEECQRPCAVFAATSQVSVSPGNHFEGVILGGHFSSPRVPLNLMEIGGGGEKSEAFALFYTPNDMDGRFVFRNFDTLLTRERDQVVVEPDIPYVISAHLPTLAQEAGGRIYSFSREALGKTVFRALCREATSISTREETETPAVDLRPSGQQGWNLWAAGHQLASLSPYGKFREIYPGSVIALHGKKYRVASIDPGDNGGQAPAISLESAEALSNLRTVPSFSASVVVQEESLCLSLAPGVSLHLGRVAVTEELLNVSVIDETDSPDLYDESSDGQEGQQLVTATFTPDEEITWSINSQAFWIEVAGLTENRNSGAAEGTGQVDAPVVTALEQIFRVGANFTFLVDKYDLATYSQGSTIFLVEVSPESVGIVKKVFDHWRDILHRGASLARLCRWAEGSVFCPLPVSPNERGLDKVGGLALSDRLLEITAGS